MGKTVNIGGRIHNPEVGNVVAGANEILDDTKGKKQNVINSEVDTALAGLDSGKQDKLTFDQTPTESSTNPVTSGGVYAADQVLQQAIEAILLLIPSAASVLNQLADKSFVNSSIATASATFRGTYNLVSDLHLSVSASHQDIATALASVVATADNNDYCFVQVPTSDTSSDIRVTERYKFNGTDWQYEYDLNNSGFTAQQWAAINSTITSALVGKLTALPTADELAALLAGKQATLTFDSTPAPGSANPVTSGGLYDKFEAIIAKIPSDASANNKLVAENRLAAYVGGIIGALDATFDLTSTDGHVTLKITQTDGLIASVQVLTSDIASAAQVSQNTSDIATLQDLYNALQQSAPEIIQPTDTWPVAVADRSATVIYRVIDRVNTPPEYYSDYMFKASDLSGQPVLMATYNNAIDQRPKKGSANLVTSGGVFDNMGALDISELNATGGTLATYATLDAAIAAIPSDYQKGGMSIKFVSSVDNTYVQFRLMKNQWSTTPSDWQGADDTPTAGSDNLVKSGGVAVVTHQLMERSVGENLIDPKYIVKGYYLNNDDGTLVENYTGGVSDYIPLFVNGVLQQVTSKNAYVGGVPWVATYCIYDKDFNFIRSSRVREYTSNDYQQGDYYIRYCLIDSVGLASFVANYGTTAIDYIPYTGTKRIDDLESGLSELGQTVTGQGDEIENISKKLNIEGVTNGEYSLIANGSQNYWPTDAAIRFVGDYMELDYPSERTTYFFTTNLLVPDMGEYLYLKAKVTNLYSNSVTFNLMINPTVAPGDHSWVNIGSIGLQAGESKDVYFAIDLSNLVIYHSFENTCSLWFGLDYDGLDTTTLRFEDLEVYQTKGKVAFNNIDGDNCKELFESVDEKFDTITGTAQVDYLVSPNGTKYIMSANNNGQLVLLPLLPSNVYYLGNSLLNSRGFGLAAPDPQHDYYALMNQYFESQISGVLTTQKAVANPFEMATTLSEAKTLADGLISDAPASADLMVLQLGDNASPVNYDTVFKPALEYLVQGLRSKATSARVILVGCWYGSAFSAVLEPVAKKYGCTAVNISPLRLPANESYIGAIINVTSSAHFDRTLAGDVTNLTELTNDRQDYNYKLSVEFTVNNVSYSTVVYCFSYTLTGATLVYDSYQEIIDNAGEASHPGVNGFRLIANKILYDGGFVETTEYYPSN